MKNWLLQHFRAHREALNLCDVYRERERNMREFLRRSGYSTEMANAAFGGFAIKRPDAKPPGMSDWAYENWEEIQRR